MANAARLIEDETRLAAQANRVRKSRIVAGACRVAVAALLAGIGIVQLDLLLGLSVLSRCLFEAAWLGLLGVLVWRFVVRPWHEEVNLDEALPAKPIAVAGLAALAAIALAIATPGAGEQLRRVALPWHRPRAAIAFEIVVTSGDAVVRRGDPVTLTAYLRPKDAAVDLPDAAALIVRDVPEGTERALPMSGDPTATFHLTLPAITGDFEYRIEAGPATSDWYAVRAADAVELTDRSCATIAPPEYAAQLPAKTIAGFADLEGLQYSTANFRLHFNRPADSASLEWRPDGRSSLEPPDAILVELAADRCSGSAAFRMRTNGVLRVLLVNEPGPRKLRTETAVTVRVLIDAPPKYELVAGLSRQVRTVRPGDRLLFEFGAVDDVGIGSAELEHSSGPVGASTRQPIALEGAGAPRAGGRMAFALPASLKDGESIRFRLRVRDNRGVDDARLGPQEVLYPADGWSEYRISGSAPPLDRQEVFGLRDTLRESLNAAREEVNQARVDAEALRAETAERAPLPIDHGLRLMAIRDRVRNAKSSLQAAEREAGLTPDVRALASAFRDAVERPLKDADESVQRAATDDAADRTAALGAALKHLRDAAERIADLLQRNERLAQDLLDCRRLEALAADQTALAASAKPGADTSNAELQKRQGELLARLHRLLAESEPLRRGADAAAAREAVKFADEAKAIANRIRDLDAAATRLNAELRQSLLDGLAAAQTDHLRRAEKLQPRLGTPIRLAGLAPPRREDFLRIAELIGRDKIVDALTDLERLAQSLDRVAFEFEKWAADRRDPKLAAEQIAKWQDDLRTRFLAAVKTVPFAALPDAQKLAMRGEQAAIQGSSERLRIPASSEIGALREATTVHLKMAAMRLDGDGVGADQAMKFAAEAHAKLAEKSPSAADRLARGRTEFDKIRTEQEAIVAGAEHVLRAFDKQVPNAPVIQALLVKFLPWELRQKKLAERLAALDLPGHEPRQARAVRAAKTAAADLRDGLPYDAIASLAGSKRELDRLRQALDNAMPADDTASELARKQAEVARLLAAAGEGAAVKQLEPIVALQLEVLRLRNALAAPESPALLHDAHAAVELAGESLNQHSDHARIVRRAREAAEALALLADRLTDRESDRDRVNRLASNRRQAECVAKQRAGKDQNAAASQAARDELLREIDELLFTRVGEAGQVPKKAVLEAYLQLKNKSEPDRQARDQKQLAAALSELAAAMAAVAELAGRPPAAAPGPPDPADAFLPSRLHADSLRELSRQQRELREQINGFSAEAIARTKPAAQEKVQHDSLAKKALELALALDCAAADATPGDALGKSLAEAADLTRKAERMLMDAANKAAVESSQLRVDAERVLLKAADKAALTALPIEDLPDASARASSVAARDAERAMLQAIRALGEKGNASAAEPAMRRAGDALKRAARR